MERVRRASSLAVIPQFLQSLNIDLVRYIAGGRRQCGPYEKGNVYVQTLVE